MILRGMNRSGMEYSKENGNGMSEVEFQYICNQWKAQIVRIPFNQDWITNDPNYVDLLDQVIGWINKAGAYALIDLHWESTDVKQMAIPNAMAAFMWQTLAAMYKDNPGVLYDIHNEAHDTTWEAWRNRATLIIESIRTVHPKALIFVSGLDWAYDLRGWQADPLPYANIVYATHPYPFKGEPWAWDKYFGTFADSYPVLAGEFGGEDTNLEWGRQIIRYFNEKQIGWTAWSWVDNPRLTQDDRRTPTKFGKLVRTALLRHAGVDSVQLAISGITVQSIGCGRATISWKTSAIADSKIRYGLTAAYSDSVSVTTQVSDHSIQLSGLISATTYHYQVISQDWYGDIVESQDKTFEMLP